MLSYEKGMVALTAHSEGGGGDNSDLLHNLLGVEDAAIDRLLDSADSAAKLLGVPK